MLISQVIQGLKSEKWVDHMQHQTLEKSYFSADHKEKTKLSELNCILSFFKLDPLV